MWQPGPAWRRLPAGPSSGGAWVAERDGRQWVVKRLPRPEPGDRSRSDPRHAGFWRREAEVAADPGFVDGPGLVPPTYGPVEEDDEGLTVWAEEVVGEPPPGLFVARGLGRFASAPHADRDWASRDLLADRLALAERRGGWPTLQRTTLADVADRIWTRRGHWLDRLASGPQGRVHGDLVPGNLLAARGEDVVAVDWQCCGTGPVGADLGYFALSSREDFGILLETFLSGVSERDRGLDREAVATAARVTAVYSVLTRAEWALSRAAAGEGALAGKFKHPAVAPHLRALQRQAPQLELLLL